MDNSVYLDEDIPFVESGDYEIGDVTSVNHNGTANLTRENLISLSSSANSFHDDSIWNTNTSSKRGRRPQSTPIEIHNTMEDRKSVV